jgi:hypothetical protein
MNRAAVQKNIRQHISSAIWGHVLTEVLVVVIAPLRELDETDRHAVTHILITYSDFFLHISSEKDTKDYLK